MKPARSHFSFSTLCLIIAILASIAVSSANLIKLRTRIIALHNEAKAQRLAKEETARQLTQTKATLESSLASLKATKTALETSNKERDQALTKATAEAKRSEEFAQKLKDVRQERDEARNELARYTNSGLTAEQVSMAAKTIEKLQTSWKTAQAENAKLSQELSVFNAKADKDSPVPLPANLITRVKVADPKWHFVILDAGRDRGMLERGELLVSREGRLLGKVKVSRVEKDRCIADLSPEWDLAEVREGDLAVPANPTRM